MAHTEINADGYLVKHGVKLCRIDTDKQVLSFHCKNRAVAAALGCDQIEITLSELISIVANTRNRTA